MEAVFVNKIIKNTTTVQQRAGLHACGLISDCPSKTYSNQWCMCLCGRYIKALQQFQRISSLIDAVAAQQMKLEARRDHLQTLMTALSTMYKVVKGHHRPMRTPAAVGAVPLLHDTVSYAIPLTVVDSQVTSSTSTDCYLAVADDLLVIEQPDATVVQDLRLVEDKVAVAAGCERPRELVTRSGGCGGPTDVMLVAAHTTRNRVDISSSSLECPPPAHSAKVDISGCTYIVRNSCDVAATDA